MENHSRSCGFLCMAGLGVTSSSIHGLTEERRDWQGAPRHHVLSTDVPRPCGGEPQGSGPVIVGHLGSRGAKSGRWLRLMGAVAAYLTPAHGGLGFKSQLVQHLGHGLAESAVGLCGSQTAMRLAHSCGQHASVCAAAEVTRSDPSLDSKEVGGAVERVARSQWPASFLTQGLRTHCLRPLASSLSFCLTGLSLLVVPQKGLH